MRKLSLALAALLALPAAAQNVDIEALSGLQFNFGNPGARSLGMGGAFLGLADDASAIEANPAGLTILRKPEISIEGRNYQEQQTFTTSGTFPDLVRTPFTYYSDRAQVSFASVVIPIKSFTVGAYYHEPLNNEGGGIVAPQRDEFTGDPISATPNFFLPADGGQPITEVQCENLRRTTNNPFACLEYRLDPYFSVLSVRQRTFGIAGAWQIHPKFSVGATVRHQRFQEAAYTFRFDQNLDPATISVQATAKVDDDGVLELVEETDLTFGAGFRWAPTDKISIGGVYKKGPTFDAPLFFASTSSEFGRVAETQFHIPDIAGLGISVRPLPVLTINVDAVHVTYENLVDDFVAQVADVRDLEENPFGVDNVTELHVGAEYVFTTKVPFALRAGFWHDPAHTIEWRGPLDRPDFIAEAILYPEGESQNHLSIGGGFAWPRFQIDFAYDTSDTYKVGSISMVTRF